MTKEDIENMPSGRVLLRWQTPKGSHQKMRVVRPVTYQSCDICNEGIAGNAVKTEMGGNKTVLTQCPDCALCELSER